MTVKKTGDGVYRVDMRPQGKHGRRIRKTFKTRAEALRFERHTLATQNNKDWIEKPADRRPLSQLIELWWKHHGITLKSGAGMHGKLKNLDAALNYPKAYQINKKLFSEYQAMRLEEGKKPETINKAQWLLSGVFTILIRKGHYHSDNPLAGIRSIKLEAREMGFLTSENVSELLNNLTGDNLRAAKLSLATGGRWGEVSGLRRTAVIKYKVTYLNTKNGKNRTVPVTPILWEEITAGTGPVLFPHANYSGLRETLAKLFPWLPDGQALHVLRHTFASHFMMKGGNILALQKILGHSTITQTMVYAHFAPDYLQDAARFNPLEGDPA